LAAIFDVCALLVVLAIVRAQRRMSSPELRPSASPDAALDTEFIALRVGQYYPARPVGPPMVFDQRRPERQDPLHLLLPGLRSRLSRRQVQVNAVLDLLGLG